MPWTVPEAASIAVVHAGDSLADLLAFTREVRSGRLPSNPYLVIGQQSLVDPGRAPPSCHTLWTYSRVPNHLAGGWANSKESFADRIEQRIEGLAPGFRHLILARAVASPDDLEAMNENLVGGDLGGGSVGFHNSSSIGPLFPIFAIARRFAVFTSLPLRRIPAPASTAPVASTPRTSLWPTRKRPFPNLTQRV